VPLFALIPGPRNRFLVTVPMEACRPTGKFYRLIGVPVISDRSTNSTMDEKRSIWQPVEVGDGVLMPTSVRPIVSMLGGRIVDKTTSQPTLEE